MRKKIIMGIGVVGLSLASFGGFTNVGEVVRALGGQGKNSLARGLCTPG